jgi:tRNA(adenine34) deaminase
MIQSDDYYMQLALDQAHNAALIGEVPVGAVLVKDGQVIAHGFNQVITQSDPTGHAEIVALRRAAEKMANYRLPGHELFVTLEPCAMCVGAILHARLSRVVFGAFDSKTGACGSVLDVGSVAQINHQTTFCGGVMAEACARILKDFFAVRRMPLNRRVA